MVEEVHDSKRSIYLRSVCKMSSATFRLVEEVHEINETVDNLKAKLREAENALQHLLRTKASLEQVRWQSYVT